MTRKTCKTLTAGLIATAMGMASLTGPAAAGGSISLSFLPQSAEDARVLQTGLRLYSVVNAVQNGAGIKQIGKKNAAGIGQNGRGNLGIVHQEGKGHSGTLQQNGSHNAYGLFQFGRNTSADIVQNGYGQAGATFQFGW